MTDHKFDSHLKVFCPHCQKSFNKTVKGDEHITLKANINGQDAELKIKPYLENPEFTSSIGLKDDDLFSVTCPHCGADLTTDEHSCQTCACDFAKVLLAGADSLLPLYLRLKAPVKWVGLSKADETKLKPKVQRQKMPEQDPKVRIHNFEEVPYGLTTELAMLEASRCIQCKNPKCMQGCPVSVKIPEFIKLITEGKFAESAQKIKETNMLPAVCGRVCPQEDQCEKLCVLGVQGQPVAIGNLERFVADFERNMKLAKAPEIKTKLPQKVAIIGSGPGGITCAADMARMGYSVTMFEALHAPGGVLIYGIPEFRLPKAIVHNEINVLKQMGVRIELNHIIGTIYTVDELLEEYDAAFIAVGAGTPRFLGIPGESMNNIFSANEYLTRINLMKAYKFPEYDTPMPRGKKIAVIGAGNVAMDCARNALRTGAKEVHIVYRRSRNELPAREEEIHHAEQEGVIFDLLTNPVGYIGNERNWVTGLTCVKMRLGEPDDSGRRRPVPVEGSEFSMDFDMVIVAVGTDPNPIIFGSTPDLQRNRWGNIAVDDNMQTSKARVWAGGDIVTGSATVIEAMGAGRVAAASMHKYLQGDTPEQA